jgi:hypothetical protein
MILSANRRPPGPRPCAAALLGLILAACNSGPVETAQYDAKDQCFRRFLDSADPIAARKLAKFIAATDKFPGKNSKPPPEFDLFLQIDESQFRFVSTGHFVVDWKRIVVKGHPEPFHVTCTGDFNARRITSVTYNGTIKRPKPGEVWSF